MPVFFLNLAGLLATIASSLVGRVLLALGIGYVSYSGINVLMDGLHNLVIAKFNNLPANILIIASMLNIGKSINIIFSAIAVRATLDGLTSGKITKMIIK